MKRVFDIVASLFGLILTTPLLLLFMLLVWFQDFRSPFYVAKRVGRDGQPFQMVKLRSMVVAAEQSGVTSTADGDKRITYLGRLIRKLKLDEVTQLWNVLLGDMSMVGPRPNVAKWGVDLYTSEEMRLLSVRPGITDFSSVVFADEGAILSTALNPDLEYNQLIRPWKSRLSLFYVDNQSMRLDIKLILATILSVVWRKKALRQIERELARLDAPQQLIEMASRKQKLFPYPPPGSDKVASLSK